MWYVLCWLACSDALLILPWHEQSRLRAEVQHLQALLDSQKGEIADLKRRNAQTERELRRVAASDPEESLVSPSKSYAAFAPPTLRDPAPRYMGESRVANALPEPPAPRTNGYKAEGTFGSGYGSVHASRSASPNGSRGCHCLDQHCSAASVDLKRASLQFPSSTSPVPASPKRRMWE